MGKNKHVLYYKSTNFSVSVKQKYSSTSLFLSMHNGLLSTSELTHTLVFLKTYTPTVLKTECFNPLDLPFHKEVINTEIGHLFEHILLDELRILNESNSKQGAVHNGVTSWDFEVLGVGVFQIWVDTGYNEEPLFHTALNKTIYIFEKLLNTKNTLENAKTIFIDS